MKHSVVLLALIAMLSAWPAAAQQGQRAERGFDRGSERSFDRGSDRRGDRGFDFPGPRQAPQRGDVPPPRQAGWPGHMSPEERQQLRRDIDQHGRDLYRDRRDRR